MRVWLLCYVLLSAMVVPVWAGGLPDHPMGHPAAFTEHPSCEVCGMNRNVWARTRYRVQDDGGTHYLCSLHCVAALIRASGRKPQAVQVALYLDPTTMIDARQAVYVVGSDAPGTMTPVSKLAFANGEQARSFVVAHGGEITDFATALARATAELGNWPGGKGRGHGHGMDHGKGMDHGGMHHGTMGHGNMEHHDMGQH